MYKESRTKELVLEIKKFKELLTSHEWPTSVEVAILTVILDKEEEYRKLREESEYAAA